MKINTLDPKGNVNYFVNDFLENIRKKWYVFLERSSKHIAEKWYVIVESYRM